MRRACLLLALPATAGWGKTVGLWEDAPCDVSDGLVKARKELEPAVITAADLSDGAKLAPVDVICLPGGWKPCAAPPAK